jgi:hypothetical protein
MAVSKEKKSTGDKKPKHGMDKNRPNKDTGSMRSAATVRLPLKSLLLCRQVSRGLHIAIITFLLGLFVS